MDTTESMKGVPESKQERDQSAESIADEVRALRRKLDEVAPGPRRKTERKRILLQIEVRRWKMGLLDPKKYGKKVTAAEIDKRDLVRILRQGANQRD